MSQERAARWKAWTQTLCYAELEGMMRDIRTASVSDTDRVPTAELNVAVIAECRGMRKALDILERRIGESLSPTRNRWD